jgi:hypothetical protein
VQCFGSNSEAWVLGGGERVQSSFHLQRRDLLKGALAAATAALGSSLLRLKKVAAHAMLPGEWDRSGYWKAIKTDSEARATFASPHLKNVGTYLVQAQNWFEAMEVSYEYDPDEIRLVMANYGPMNFITYDDYIWKKYEVGAWQGITDPKTGAPALRNIYLDDITKLQNRHAVLLV